MQELEGLGISTSFGRRQPQYLFITIFCTLKVYQGAIIVLRTIRLTFLVRWLVISLWSNGRTIHHGMTRPSLRAQTRPHHLSRHEIPLFSAPAKDHLRNNENYAKSCLSGSPLSHSGP